MNFIQMRVWGRGNKLILIFHISTQATVYFPYHFHTILQCPSCCAWAVVMQSVYSEICVCSDTFRHLLSSHKPLVLVEHLFYNSQHGSRSLTGAHVYRADVSSALEVLSGYFSGGFVPRLDVQFSSGELKRSQASSFSRFREHFTRQKSTEM